MISAERLSSEREQIEGSARPDKQFYAEVMRELEAARARIAELEKRIRGYESWERSVSEALNSGDGSYRP